jgi:hypothetical protein
VPGIFSFVVEACHASHQDIQWETGLAKIGAQILVSHGIPKDTTYIFMAGLTGSKSRGLVCNFKSLLQVVLNHFPSTSTPFVVHLAVLETFDNGYVLFSYILITVI